MITTSKEMREQLKFILCGYSTYNSKMAKGFKELGFIIIRNKKHVILQYYINDKSFVFTLSKTPSDKRAGNNLACTIYRTLKNEIGA